MVLNQKKPFRVCLDARIIDGMHGGIQQFVMGLAWGLSQLNENEAEEFVFLSYPGHTQWLQPCMGGPCSLLPAPFFSGLGRFIHRMTSASFLRFWVQSITKHFGHFFLRLPESDMIIEHAGVDLMHFTFQTGYLTRVPTIYQPHDLQHLHLPEYFSRSESLVREKLYRAFCEQAQMVAVENAWIKMDLMQKYQLPGKKIQVIPAAPSIDAYPAPSEDDLRDIKNKFDLPDRFLVFPAQTWPHKNHMGLLDALALLGQRHGIYPAIVCTGKKNEFFPKIKT